MNYIKKYLIKYSVVIIYVIFAILIEMFGSLFTDGKFYIKDPRYLFTIVGAAACILLLIRNSKARVIVASCFLVLLGLVNIVFIVLFEMAGQWFDYSMFALRNDAMGILENLPINFWFFFLLGLSLSAFIVFGIRFSKLIKDETPNHKLKIIRNSVVGTLIGVFVLLNVLTAASIHDTKKDYYMEILKSEAVSKYNQYGITSNFINEVYGGTVFANNKTLADEEIKNYLYQEVSATPEYFGISKGNNVITILGETFEWISFVANNTLFGNVYPNGMTISLEQARELFPNIYSFYDNSIRFTNYHAREKTDISENYSILGSYPVGTYINYDYYKNVLPQSMPNMLKNLYGESNYTSQYFHNGESTFYNRYKSVTGLGFDDWYTSEKMEDLDESFHNYIKDGERNLDSMMINTCSDLMFPTSGKKFYTYITTISMHGLYAKRDNLAANYDKLREYGMDVDGDISEDKKIYYCYLAASLELDKAIGELFNELNTRTFESGEFAGEKLIDHTTILIFGDHQGYYQGLSNYVKGISSANQCEDDDMDYMELYRVPCMIYDKKLVTSFKANNSGSQDVDKFGSSCDIVPTLLGLLGVKYYSNIYYGNSMFTDTKSLIYSRGYGYFLDEYSYFYNINSFSYINPVVNSIFGSKNNYISSITTRGEKLMTKIKYVDNSYKTKIFNDEANYQEFYQKINSLNA